MMRNIFVVLGCCLVSLTIQAQSKADQVKHIRQVYAEAKQKVADNGKDGKAPIDMHILVNDGTVVDEDFELDNVTSLYYYFDKMKKDPNTDLLDSVKCYLIIEDWTSHGHTRYREFLFDPDKGHLIFAYMKGETDGGFIVETRYYYDDKGNLIDQIHKTGNEGLGVSEVEPDSHSWNDAESEKKAGDYFLDVFHSILFPNSDFSAASERSGKATPKAERMKFIRETYAQAKQKIELDKQAGLPRNIQVTIHDQRFEVSPPITREINYYFEDVMGQDTSEKHCYFVSDHMSFMGLDRYCEYLFDTKSHDLIFSYDRGREEDEEREWRYYFNENRKCIEAKSEAEEIGDGLSEKMAAKNYVDTFRKLICE